MKTRAFVHSSNVVSAQALENVDLKGRCQLLHRLLLFTWYDLEPNMQDEQFLVPMANLILSFQLNFAIFCTSYFVRTHHNALRFTSVSHVTVGLAQARPN